MILGYVSVEILKTLAKKSSKDCPSKADCFNCYLGGGGKALTKTMTPWGLEFDPWSLVKMVILWLNFVVTILTIVR